MAMRGRLTQGDEAVAHLRRVGGLAQQRDFAAIGIPPVVLRRLLSAGKLSTLGWGVYALPETAEDPWIDYAAETLSAPHGSYICMLTAAYMHGLVQRDPRELHILMPKGAWNPKSLGLLTVVSHQWPCMDDLGILESPDAGVDPADTVELSGRTFNILSRAKTVADLLVYRGVVGVETAMEALGTALSGPKPVALSEIEAYAEQWGKAREVRPYLAGAGTHLNRAF